MEKLTGQEFMVLLRSDPEKALEFIYKNHYQELCQRVNLIISDSKSAEDIVQEVIFELWKKKDHLNITKSALPYLRTACRNRALNHLRDKAPRTVDDSLLQDYETKDAGIYELMEADEVEKKIQLGLEMLPEKCRVVFVLSRYEELTYNEIAAKLEISVKTVENQISKALQILRANIFSNKE
ncbi:MAG: RNA polymerase sigma-70 factor [Saprospiraceae bacterium]|nr:RNA polymerase sigma-70 factor [Saprospiraceae bacterium]